MRDAIIARSANSIKLLAMLAAVLFCGFPQNSAMAGEAHELSPSVVLLQAPQTQTDSLTIDDILAREANATSIDAVLDNAVYVVTEEPVFSKQKPFLTHKQRVSFISPTPSSSWRSNYGRYVLEAARAHGLPPELIMAVIAVESGFNPNARNGTSYGLMQVKITTAREFGLGRNGTVASLMDPATNIRVGANYLGKAWKQTGGNICATVSRYNQGLGSRKINAAYCAKVSRIMRYADFHIE